MMMFDPPSADAVLALALRATAVLAVAVAIAWALRRGTAASRHQLWTATFVVLLALPAISTWLPRWELEILPARGVGTAVERPAAEAGVIATPITTGKTRDGVGEATSGPAGAGSIGAGVPETATPAPWRSASASPDAARTGPAPGPIPALILLWGAGTLIALVSLLVGHLRFRRLVNRGHPIEDPHWTRLLISLGMRFGIERPVTLVESADAPVPMTGGFRRPAIVLPAGARGWTADRRRAVLAHELVHVRRHDALRQLVGRLALALYWFHPLAWLADRDAGINRELACDDEVLSMGTRPSAYASLLLDLAGGAARPARAPFALAMIHPSQLERRLMSILDPTPRKRSALATASALLGTAAFGMSAAMAQPVPVSVQEAPTAPPPEVVEVLDRLAPIPPRPPADKGAPRPIGGEPSRALRDLPPVPPTLPQEARCRTNRIRGNFSGSLSYRENNRQEMSGRHEGDRVIQRYVDDLRLCMRIHGDVELSEGYDEILSIGDADSWVVLESEEGEMRRLVVRGGAGSPEHIWTVAGEDRPFDAEAREWRDRMFTVLGGFWEAARLRGRQASLRGEIASYRGEVASMNGQIASHRGEVAHLRGQIASERGRISGMRGQISGLNARISGLQAARRGSSDDTRRSLESEIETLRQQISRLQTRIEEGEVKSRISALEAEIEEYDLDEKVRAVEARRADFDLDTRVAAVERDIVELRADERAETIERRIAPDIEALRRMIRGR